MRITDGGREIDVRLQAKLVSDPDGGVIVCGECGEEIAQVFERDSEHMQTAHGETWIERGVIHRPGWKQDGDVWRRGSPGRWARGHRVHIDGDRDDWYGWSHFPMVAECPRRPPNAHLNILDSDRLHIGWFPSPSVVQ